MVKMSVDFPNEAAGCQRFSSGQAQVITRELANSDLPPGVTELISAATG